jgi:molybdopterin-guanine dinucleotide biosynthesis protein B
MDIVLTEGYKNAGMPQVEVFLSTSHQRPMYEKEDPGTLVAVVSDVSLDLGVPRFHIDDVIALADFIEARFLDHPAEA